MHWTEVNSANKVCWILHKVMTAVGRDKSEEMLHVLICFTAGILPLLLWSSLLCLLWARHGLNSLVCYYFSWHCLGYIFTSIVFFLDKFETSKGFNGCFSKAWFYWQISDSTSIKTTGKKDFLWRTFSLSQFTDSCLCTCCVEDVFFDKCNSRHLLLLSVLIAVMDY